MRDKQICGHPSLYPTEWEQKRPESAEMIETCCHRNMHCPICGYGWGCAPCPCKEEKGGDELTRAEFYAALEKVFTPTTLAETRGR